MIWKYDVSYDSDIHHRDKHPGSIRTKMVEKIAFNFSSDQKYVNRLWQCTHCASIDSQSHVLICAGYKHLREGKDLGSDNDLVSYFRDLISIRDKIKDIV